MTVDLEPVGLCHAPAAGVKECLPLPGEVGSTTMVTTCLPDEGCQYWPLTVPDCSGEPEIRFQLHLNLLPLPGTLSSGDHHL